MIGRNGCRLLVAGFVPASLILFAGSASSATAGNYRGKTSQREPISFVVSGGFLRKLDVSIDERCPGGRTVRTHDYSFPSVRITRSKFNQTFVETKSSLHATAQIKGSVLTTRVSGSLTEATLYQGHYCRGTATFKLSELPQGSGG